MLAVSLQPVPLRWILNVVPAGPRATSSGNAVGMIQNVPFLRAPPAASAQKACEPPRSSGASNLNSTFPDASALASVMGLECSSQPPPLMRLPVTVVQLRTTVLPASKPVPLTVIGVRIPPNVGLATKSPCGGNLCTSFCTCCSGGGGKAGSPGVIVKLTLNCARSGAG